MDHDRLFKELLSVFFVEFVQLFLPDVAAYLDPASIEFLDKEVFTDVTVGAKHEVDLVVKARFQQEDAFFLVHVENESTAKPGFPRRMFRYFARLHEKYNLPVYPVVVFSYDTPRRAQPDVYKVELRGQTVLQFQYRVVQLNRMNWSDYASIPNPVASALMAKMRIAPKDRPKVRVQCFRLLATLKLDPAKSRLIGGFIEMYLKLNATEMQEFERELDTLAPREKEAAVELMTSWERKGREEGLQEGRQEGKEDLVIRQIRRRFGAISTEIADRLGRLSSDQLNDLGVALLDFETAGELDAWLLRFVA